ncbi:hypothetical protein BGX34_006583, partial [Mortierella sp. NVP85]
MAATPPSSIFNVPELVGLVAQYLNSRDVARCMATSKAWVHLFESFLWQDVVLKRPHPTPQILARNRHRIRSLRIASYDYPNLQALAADLPNTPFSEPSQESRDSTSSSTATGNNIFQNLRIIRIDNDYPYRWKLRCLDYILRILHQSPSLLQLSLPSDILDDSVTSDQTESFLYAMAHKLPCIKGLDIRDDLNSRGHKVLPKIGLELLRVCLSHPQLANLHCNFRMNYLSTKDFHQINAFLNSVEDNKKAKEATGKSALGSPIKSLRFPEITEGYPPNYLCTLLRSCLPNLELLYLPDVGGNRELSFVESLRDAVAQGCPKLQHLRCSWYDDEESHNVINGIVKGCKQWGLKSFHCEKLEDDESRCILETLLSNHSNTLEEVELVHCQVNCYDLVDLLSCRNLKKVKILQSSDGDGAIELHNVKFKCRDLKELQLSIVQPEMDYEDDDF